jgi:formylglycine-generating enzyme required for sulfatase activity
MMRTTLLLCLAILLCTRGSLAAESPAPPAERPAGTGVIVHADGYVLTAHHVVANTRKIVVVTAGEVRNPAVVVSADKEQDLALLKIETVGLSDARIGHTGAVRLDQEVVVVGFPFGLREAAVVRGRIAAVRTKGVRRVFQLDAAVNPGNSGGAIFDLRGEIIGIVTTKFNHPSGIVPEGMAFAVPISYATPLLANIPEFDFAAIGKGRKELKRDTEKLIRTLVKATVRIETLAALEPVSATAGQAGPSTGASRIEPVREPVPASKPGQGPEPVAEERDDPAAIGRVNQQLAKSQQEELQEFAQRGITPPAGMVLIPAGEFLMGIENGPADARPQRRIFLSSYWIDRYEVTNAQYRACVMSGVCTPPKDRSAFDDHRNAQHPVTDVTWLQAREFCQWSGRRLPTEAEWEKAARGTDGRRYPWGNSAAPIKDRIRINEQRSSRDGTEPVGSQAGTASPYGVHDLVGNVWEWVKDWYAENAYESAPTRDPQGPLHGSFRVLRGGGWRGGPLELRTGYRGWDEMTYWGPMLGFRCADDVP